MTERIVRMAELESLVGYKKSAIYAKVATGEFPPPVRLGPGAVGWRASTIAEWIETRPVAARHRGNGDG